MGPAIVDGPKPAEALDPVVDDATIKAWFCQDVLPLESALSGFIRRNWRLASDIGDLRQDIYERAIGGARKGIPVDTRRYLFTVARNHLINLATRANVVSFDLVADMATFDVEFDRFGTERQLTAREQLRRTQQGLNLLPPRCREIVWLRKVEGLSTRETAERLSISAETVEKQISQGMRALVDYMLGGSGKIARAPVFRRASRRRWR